MADIIELIKKQSEKGISELRELSGRLSEKLKSLINLLPEDTRHKSVDTFLNDIRESVFGEAPRRITRRAKRAAAPKRARKAVKGKGRRGRRKKETVTAVETEQKPS